MTSKTSFSYAGIGSRETPLATLSEMVTVAAELAGRNWMLRSGNAEGADSAFLEGTKAVNGPREIYVPWNGYEGAYHGVDGVFNAMDLPNWGTANAMAIKMHPAWTKCSRGAQLLHTRNIYQILGQDLKSPVNCVIAWTKDGKATGGTGQAIRLAEYLEIPVFNLFNLGALDALGEFVYQTETAALVRDQS